MTLPVKLKDVVAALDEGGDELSHYMDKRSGEIFLITNEEMSAAEEDEHFSDYPEWQQERTMSHRKNDTYSMLNWPDGFDRATHRNSHHIERPE